MLQPPRRNLSHPPHTSSLRHQRGAYAIVFASVMAALTLLVALVLDSGRLYLEKRTLQKVADMAALETIARLHQGDCSQAPHNAQLFATQSAASNRFSLSATRTLHATCVVVAIQDGERHGLADPDGKAVEVTVTHRVPASLVSRLFAHFNPDFPHEVTLGARAIAERQAPVAAFNIGSQLARLDNDRLLGLLLQSVGLNPDLLTVLDADGLANAAITPAGLLEALGVELGIRQLSALSPQELVSLVDTQVGVLSLDQLIDLSLDLVSDAFLRANLASLQNAIAANAQLRDIDLRLFGLPGERALIRLGSEEDQTVGAALGAALDFGELLRAGLYTGTQQRAIHVPGLNVLGLANVELGVVEPPSFAIGPTGTQAYNAQIRLYIDIDTDKLLGGALSWLTSTLLGTRIHLPISIDLVSGKGTLNHIQCNTTPPTADIEVESQILNLCVGHIPPGMRWSTHNSCDAAVANTELIRLLHLPVLTGRTTLPALTGTDLLTGIAAGESAASDVNPVALGDAVDNLVTSLLDLLSGLFRKPVSELADQLDYSQTAQNQLISDLARQYLEATKKNGFYNTADVIDLVLNGSEERDEHGNPLLPPLTDDWFIPNSIPTTCLLSVCPISLWKDGTFSQAMDAYSKPGGLLDLLGISTLGNGYYSCGGLLSALLAWNTCLHTNLTKLLQDKPGGINLSQNQDGTSIANPNTNNVSCSGFLCILLKPVLQLLKPILNGIGHLLDTLLADVLGLELGRTYVHVQSVSCNAPALIH